MPSSASVFTHLEIRRPSTPTRGGTRFSRRNAVYDMALEPLSTTAIDPTSGTDPGKKTSSVSDGVDRPDHYGAIVIGSGQGGTPLTLALAHAGHRTLLIEATHVGGSK